VITTREITMEQAHENSPLTEAAFGTHELPIGVAARLQQKVMQNSKVTFVDPSELRLHPANTRDLDADPAAITALAESLRQHGQQVACIGRRLDDHIIELVAGKRRWQAVCRLREAGSDIGLMVEVRRMNDEEAYRLIEAENSERKNMTPLEQGRF
jgi:ParB/RepB/Spo0J family partition protein